MQLSVAVEINHKHLSNNLKDENTNEDTDKSKFIVWYFEI